MGRGVPHLCRVSPGHGLGGRNPKGLVFGISLKLADEVVRRSSCGTGFGTAGKKNSDSEKNP